MKLFILPLVAIIGCTNESNTEVNNTTAESTLDAELNTMRINFGQDELANSWFALNDDVMGGVSVGEVSYTDNSIIFEGAVSTDNNGGFVSLRSPNDSYDLSAYTDMVISYRAIGHSFIMVLTDQPAWYAPRFELEVMEENSEWSTASVSLYDFQQYAMTNIGEVETGVEMSTEYLSDVLRMELMNTTFESGDFTLEIEYIEFQGPIE
jgi:NADH dehydrogenase [ubiquinone] 1 alpha subcomplex assembly factor 1